MKLAEALILRADCQKKISQLRQRLMRSAKVQEGEQSYEDPQVLLGELDGALAEPLRRRIAELTSLIQRINKTNASTNIDSATLSDALARREHTLGTKRGVLLQQKRTQFANWTSWKLLSAKQLLVCCGPA